MVDGAYRAEQGVFGVASAAQLVLWAYLVGVAAPFEWRGRDSAAKRSDVRWVLHRLGLAQAALQAFRAVDPYGLNGLLPYVAVAWTSRNVTAALFAGVVAVVRSVAMITFRVRDMRSGLPPRWAFALVFVCLSNAAVANATVALRWATDRAVLTFGVHLFYLAACEVAVAATFIGAYAIFHRYVGLLRAQVEDRDDPRGIKRFAHPPVPPTVAEDGIYAAPGAGGPSATPDVVRDDADDADYYYGRGRGQTIDVDDFDTAVSVSSGSGGDSSDSDDFGMRGGGRTRHASLQGAVPSAASSTSSGSAFGSDVELARPRGLSVEADAASSSSGPSSPVLGGKPHQQAPSVAVAEPRKAAARAVARRRRRRAKGGGGKGGRTDAEKRNRRVERSLRRMQRYIVMLAAVFAVLTPVTVLVGVGTIGRTWQESDPDPDDYGARTGIFLWFQTLVAYIALWFSFCPAHGLAVWHRLTGARGGGTGDGAEADRSVVDDDAVSECDDGERDDDDIDGNGLADASAAVPTAPRAAASGDCAMELPGIV